jgi:coenzyme Q-binding protein COQ10
MPHHKEKQVLPYTPAQLFDLVAGIEDYPKFLPWCQEARILERKGNIVTADLVIGYKMFSETFTSEVTLDRPHIISVRYKSGPFTHLTNRWEFTPSGKGCELTFEVDFDFSSPLLRAMMEPFFDRAFLKMVGAFESRAKELYG